VLVVGLTGGAGSGKTTVGRMLREEGAYVIDADEIAREIVKPHKPAWEALRKAFGDQILDREGAIDRKRLSERIFSDPREREQLNRILHPPIRQEILRRLREVEHRDPEAIVVIDAPLLLEVGLHHEVEKVLVVRAKESQQIERLRRRSGLSEELSRKIIGAQMPLEEKLKVADFVIPNEGSLEETRRKAKEVFRTLKRLAKQREKKKGGT
jgi:dephospho-CoA kinase